MQLQVTASTAVVSGGAARTAPLLVAATSDSKHSRVLQHPLAAVLRRGQCGAAVLQCSSECSAVLQCSTKCGQDCGYNGLGGHGAGSTALAQALAQLTALTALHLPRNHLFLMDGDEALAAALSHLPRLAVLSLEVTPCTTGRLAVAINISTGPSGPVIGMSTIYIDIRGSIRGQVWYQQAPVLRNRVADALRGERGLQPFFLLRCCLLDKTLCCKQMPARTAFRMTWKRHVMVPASLSSRSKDKRHHNYVRTICTPAQDHATMFAMIGSTLRATSVSMPPGDCRRRVVTPSATRTIVQVLAPGRDAVVRNAATAAPALAPTLGNCTYWARGTKQATGPRSINDSMPSMRCASVSVRARHAALGLHRWRRAAILKGQGGNTFPTGVRGERTPQASPFCTTRSVRGRGRGMRRRRFCGTSRAAGRRKGT